MCVSSAANPTGSVFGDPSYSHPSFPVQGRTGLFAVDKLENGYEVTVFGRAEDDNECAYPSEKPDKVYVFESARKMSRWISTFLKSEK